MTAMRGCIYIIRHIQQLIFKFPSCTIVHCSRSNIALSMRLPGPSPLPLRIYPAFNTDAAAASASHRSLTHEQLQLLLCISSHAAFFVRVGMPKDVRMNQDPRELLLKILGSAVVAQRMLHLGL